MRLASALLAVMIFASGCVLPRPHHRTALVIDGVAVAGGIGFLAADAWDCRDAGPDGCHPHENGNSSNNIYGRVLLLGGLGFALLTAIVYQIQKPAPAPSPAR